MTEPLELPDKLFFRIGEVSKLLGVQPHVLRYWETEFPRIRPQKSRTNQRLYRPADIERLARVKELLYEEGYTIAGARKRLSKLRREQRKEPERPPGDSDLSKEPAERIKTSAQGPVPQELTRLKDRCQALEQALQRAQAAEADQRARLREGLEFIRDLAQKNRTRDGA